MSGCLRLGASSSVAANTKIANTKDGRENSFVVTCDDNERLYLQASSPELARQWKLTINEVINDVVEARICKRVKELTRADAGSKHAHLMSLEMVKQAEGKRTSLPAPPKGKFNTAESKASSLLATAKALQASQKHFQNVKNLLYKYENR